MGFEGPLTKDFFVRERILAEIIAERDTMIDALLNQLKQMQAKLDGLQKESLNGAKTPPAKPE